MEFVVVGLGNTGEKYEGTRHNAGRSALMAFQRAHQFPPWEMRGEFEALSCRGTIEGTAVELLLPENFMNNSGRAVRKALSSREANAEVVVVYDDIDIPLGALKISYDRGSGGHHGVDSVISELKTRAFTRLRVGIAPLYDGVLRKPKGEDAVMTFLMKPFTPEEQTLFDDVAQKVDEALVTLIREGRARAMTVIN